MTIIFLLLGLLVAACLWTVLTSTLLRSAVALGVASAVLTAVMFEMGAPLAAVFELSVCAGLITAIFISTISLTQRLHPTEHKRRRIRYRRHFAAPLVILLAVAGVALWYVGYQLDVPVATTVAGHAAGVGVREVLWGERRLDLLGQLTVLLAGVFGVVIFFKRDRDRAPSAQQKDAK